MPDDARSVVSLTRGTTARGTLAAVALARFAFGYQMQTVASLGPDLQARFGLGYADIGTLVGLYLLPGIVAALGFGFLARRIGDRDVLATGLVLMCAGSLVSGLSAGPLGIGLGRVIAGAGAVAVMVLQGKVVADRFDGQRFMLAIGLLLGAYPVGIGLGQLTHGPIAHAPLFQPLGWHAAFLAGALAPALALGLLLLTWHPTPGSASRGGTLVWPTRRECALVLLSGLVWTSYNAGFMAVLSYTPSLLAVRGQPVWVADAVMTLATWGNLPAILLGGAIAGRFGGLRVFLFGTTMSVLGVLGLALTGVPLLFGALYGTLAAIHASVIIAAGTLSARPENRAVGMGLFYTTYYVGGAVLPPLCGRVADIVGDPSGALVSGAALSIAALPFFLLHRRLSARPV